MSIVKVAQCIEDGLAVVEEILPTNSSRELEIVRQSLETAGLFLSRLPGVHEAEGFRYSPQVTEAPAQGGGNVDIPAIVAAVTAAQQGESPTVETPAAPPAG